MRMLLRNSRAPLLHLRLTQLCFRQGEGGPLLQGALYLPGGALAVASASGGISIYSASLKLEQHLAAGTAEEPLVLIARRGRGLVSGTAAGTLQLWDLGDKADTNNK